MNETNGEYEPLELFKDTATSKIIKTLVTIDLQPLSMRRTQANIVRITGCGWGTVMHIVKKLEDQGLVITEKHGREKIIYPAENVYHIGVLLKQIETLSREAEETKCREFK